MKISNDLINKTIEKCPDANEDTYGIWECWSEDAIDLTGRYEQKILGYFEGVLSEVLEHCENLNGFYQWGDGGYLLKAPDDINIKEIKIIGDGDKQTKRRMQIDKILNDPKEFIKNELGDLDLISITPTELSELLVKYKFYKP